MVESNVPVASEEPAAEAPLTLRQRMAAIRAASYGIGKDDIQMSNADGSKKWKIKGHTIEAVLAEMRPLFDKYRVDVKPSLVERTYSGNRCDVLVDFEFCNLQCETETLTIRWAGAGTDNGDKAFAKAGTNALKEMLKKVFLITDRADAEEETDKVEFVAEAGATRAEVDKANERARAALEQWARAFKAAVSKANSLDDIKRLERENRAQLTSDDLPDVTRDFFIDLLERRKAEVA